MRDLIRAASTAFAPLLHHRNVAKGTYLQLPGDLGTRLYLVSTGALRSFHLVKDKDVTAYFALEDGVIGAIDSIIYGRPSRYGIEALEDTECAVIDYAELETFLAAHPEHERLARQISQHLYVDLVERFEGMLFLSARERYDHLLSCYPGITQRVSLGHIASYLGMTQETLSRVRAQR